MADARPLILIPSYNTGRILRETVAGTLTAGAPVWVVIDGSTDGSPESLRDFEGPANPDFRLLFLETNSGKGAAVLHALREAVQAGFTHVLAMDADGQHPASQIPVFLKISATHPHAAVFGKPIFDASAPAIRVNGRKVSNFWTHLETLGWGIDDSLFGMRVYPAKDLLAVMESTRFARRFDFDPEVAVRLAWRGVPVINLPTPVRYPTPEEGGISQFRYLRDNTLLTWMYFRLLLGFLIRLPKLLSRGPNPLKSQSPPPVTDPTYRQIAGLFQGHWNRNYVASKLRTDPLYTALAEKLHGSTFPLLDLGCGLGVLAFFLRSRDIDVPIHGLDYDSRKIEAANLAAKSAGSTGISFARHDARSGLPEHSGNVSILDILQFFTPTEQETLLKQAAARVAPGGMLIIRSGLRDSSLRFKITVAGDLIAKASFWMKAAPTHYPTADDFQRILSPFGQVEITTLWGSTPFNNHLIVLRRPQNP